MSLSSEWRNPKSSLRTYFDSRFAETRALRGEWREVAKGREVWWPYESDVRPPPAIGMVFDYRIRLALGQTLDRLKGWKGLRELNRSGSPPVTVALVNHWADEVLACDFSSLDDIEQTRHLFVLAWLEEFFRAGLQINSPIYEVVSDKPNALIEAVDDLWANDVQTMIASLEEVIGTWNQREAVFGPTFIGSYFVGGADADLITGGTLVEIKTTKNPSPDRRTFCQLAGYLLLDFIDQYDIQRVGICSGRIGTFKSWVADEYLSKLAGEDVRVDVARDELKAALGAQAV